MKEEQKGIIQTDERMGEVALPFNRDQFSNFLVSLLGKPQTITKRFEGKFEIELDNLISLYEILNQRIYQQNGGRLIQFRATVYYSDNSSVTLNGFEHLVHYNEPHPLVAEAVHLTWQFVVKFQDKDIFEKQEINVSFITPSDTPRRFDFDDDPFFMLGGQGHITLRINHTARTWGADIEALLSKHLEALMEKENRIPKFLRSNKDELVSLFRILLMFLTIIVVVINYFAVKKENPENTIMLNEYYFVSGIFIFTLYVFSYLIEWILDEIRVYSLPCYILITKETIKKKEKDKLKHSKRWWRYLGTLIFAVLTGVIANYVFAYLTGK